MTTIQNEDRENQLTPCDILSLAFMILYAFLESGTFLKGKKQFLDGQTSRNSLEDTFSKFRIVN